VSRSKNDGCIRFGALVALVYGVVMVLFTLGLWGQGPWADGSATAHTPAVYIFTFITVTHGAIALFAAYVLLSTSFQK